MSPKKRVTLSLSPLAKTKKYNGKYISFYTTDTRPGKSETKLRILKNDKKVEILSKVRATTYKAIQLH
jgi:hypothetical protein